MNKPRILLVNPPIYDFSAHDFWLKPYGLLTVGGYLRNLAELSLFDYLDRRHPLIPPDSRLKIDRFGRGQFLAETISKPSLFSSIPRYYHRYGLPRQVFREFMAGKGPFDHVLVQTVMTYWYPGVREVIEDIRELSPRATIILGGVYATLCPKHARNQGADLVIEGQNLAPLWDHLGMRPDLTALPYWDGYKNLEVGILKLADGCPFKCTYCSVPQIHPRFEARSLDRSIEELKYLVRLGVTQVAFYDDALLYNSHHILFPFLEKVLSENIRVQFHTPNALNARFIDKETAALMVRAGFKTFYLGFESNAYEWQKKTGGKVYSDEFTEAVWNLETAGADLRNITAYLIVGHPQGNLQNVEESMRFAHNLGIRVMLSEFSPIPGTPDGESLRATVDLDEPLAHNKVFFAHSFLGGQELNRLKILYKQLNQMSSLLQQP